MNSIYSWDEQMSWDEMFIRQAMLFAKKSKDPSTKVGCIIVGDGNSVLSMGFNGFPRGVHETMSKTVFPEIGNPLVYHEETVLHEERWKRPDKYNWVEHAERNAIYNAARHGVRLAGARAYINYEPYNSICEGCARALIQSGIVEIIGPDIPFGGKGAGANYHTNLTPIMCEEAGVKIRVVPWNVNWKE